MVFLAKTKSPDEWKAVTSAISTLVDEATFEATVEGLSFRGMDPSHVALIDISWPNSAFDGYECDSALKFGVRIDEFSKLMKRGVKKRCGGSFCRREQLASHQDSRWLQERV